jgi:hypothetical protein
MKEKSFITLTPGGLRCGSHPHHHDPQQKVVSISKIVHAKATKFCATSDFKDKVAGVKVYLR